MEIKPVCGPKKPLNCSWKHSGMHVLARMEAYCLTLTTNPEMYVVTAILNAHNKRVCANV